MKLLLWLHVRVRGPLYRKTDMPAPAHVIPFQLYQLMCHNLSNDRNLYFRSKHINS